MDYSSNTRILLTKKANKTYEYLLRKNDEQSRVLLSAFSELRNKLKANPQLGDCISKSKIPREFKRLGIINLYRVVLPFSWRLLYTITQNKIEILLFVVYVGDHSDYDNLMNY